MLAIARVSLEDSTPLPCQLLMLEDEWIELQKHDGGIAQM
jgi:hypothetical protein